jgi:hypothetical protein
MHAILIVLALFIAQEGETKVKAGDKARVRTLDTGLRDSPSILKKPKYMLARGTNVKVLEVVPGRNAWIRVSVKAGEGTLDGYIPRRSVMPREEYDVKEASKKLTRENVGDIRAHASSRAAARGYFNKEQKEAAAKKDKSAAAEALSHLQGLVPRTPDEDFLTELESFRKAGKLGEFQK